MVLRAAILVLAISATYGLHHRYDTQAVSETDAGEALRLSSFLPHDSASAKAASKVELDGTQPPPVLCSPLCWVPTAVCHRLEPYKLLRILPN